VRCFDALCPALNCAFDDVRGALLVLGRNRQLFSRRDHRFDVEERRERAHRRHGAVRLSCENAQAYAVLRAARERSRRVVHEFGLDFLLRLRQPDPELQAVHPRAGFSQFRAGALGMHDAAPGGHPVDRAGLDRLQRSEAVAMHDLALEQVRHGREVDVRVRPHVEALPGASAAGPM
jgi:hypothetical protein